MRKFYLLSQVDEKLSRQIILQSQGARQAGPLAEDEEMCKIQLNDKNIIDIEYNMWK